MVMTYASRRTAFGTRVFDAARTSGWTMTRLAAAIGLSQRMLSYYMCTAGADERMPARYIKAIARATDVRTDWLLGMDREE